MANPVEWHSLAKAYRAAAAILHEFQERIPNSDTKPFIFNAAHSIELILKGIIALNGAPISDGATGHDLRILCKKSKVLIIADQLKTLELLSEVLVWSGRYPEPKTKSRLEHYWRYILEHHIVRTKDGIVSRAMANPATFPNWENYDKIWNICNKEFEDRSKPNNASESDSFNGTGIAPSN